MDNLVIVESPAKAKTIAKYLGSGYKVKASMGHIRDLPKKTLGVDVEQLHKQALEKIDSDRIIFRNIGDVLSDMMPGAGDLMLENSKDTMPLYVMTNDVMVNGAGVILCQQKMDEIAEKLGGDFIVIPSNTILIQQYFLWF